MSQVWPTTISLSLTWAGLFRTWQCDQSWAYPPSIQRPAGTLREPERLARTEASVPAGHLVPGGLSQQRAEQAQVPAEGAAASWDPVSPWAQLAGDVRLFEPFNPLISLRRPELLSSSPAEERRSDSFRPDGSLNKGGGTSLCEFLHVLSEHEAEPPEAEGQAPGGSPGPSLSWLHLGSQHPWVTRVT